MSQSRVDPKTCTFCGNRLRILDYTLGGYELAQCEGCFTTGVTSLPSADTLARYYQGFRFQADRRNLQRIETPAVRSWMGGIVAEGTARMLDVGGGGGFFAKAFEAFELGTSTYVDLDERACEFARQEMQLGRVICADVRRLDEIGLDPFDFIYCRHVVEHLPEPSSFIEACLDLLAPGGTLVLHCPNGLSKEGVLFPVYWLRFLRAARRENQWSKVQAGVTSLSRGYSWGIDPIRHLWGITGGGVRALVQRRRSMETRITTASLVDPVFSPYWKPKTRVDRVSAALSKVFVPRWLQGMHLVAYIRRQS